MKLVSRGMGFLESYFSSINPNSFNRNRLNSGRDSHTDSKKFVLLVDVKARDFSVGESVNDLISDKNSGTKDCGDSAPVPKA